MPERTSEQIAKIEAMQIAANQGLLLGDGGKFVPLQSDENDLPAEKIAFIPTSRSLDLDSGYRGALTKDEASELNHYCRKTGVTERDMIDVRSEINQHGREDVDKTLLDIVKNNSLIAIGETHVPDDWLRDKCSTIMYGFRQMGATHLAVEIPDNLQSYVDQFALSGEIPKGLSDKVPLDRSYLGLLNSARKAGLKICCVDEPSKVGREQHMADKINELLESRLTTKLFSGSEDFTLNAIRKFQPP